MLEGAIISELKSFDRFGELFHSLYSKEVSKMKITRIFVKNFYCNEHFFDRNSMLLMTCYLKTPARSQDLII